MRRHKRYDMVMVRRHMDGIREFGASVIEKIKSFLNWLKTHAGKGARILIKALLRLIQAASACLAIKAGKDYKAAVSGMGSDDYKAEVEKARAKFIRAKRMVEKVGWDYINSGANNANIIGENYRSSKKRLEELENGKYRAKSALGLRLIISLSSALAAQLGIAAINARKDSIAYLRRYRRNDGPIDFLKKKASALAEKINNKLQIAKQRYPGLMKFISVTQKILGALQVALVTGNIVALTLMIKKAKSLVKQIKNENGEYAGMIAENEYKKYINFKTLLGFGLAQLIVVLTAILRFWVSRKVDPNRS